MDDFLKMDIFFVVTTVSVVVVTILLSLVLLRVFAILKNVQDISEIIEDEGRKLSADIAQVRENIKEEGLRFKHLLKFIGIGAKIKRATKKQTKKT